MVSRIRVTLARAPRRADVRARPTFCALRAPALVRAVRRVLALLAVARPPRRVRPLRPQLSPLAAAARPPPTGLAD